MRVIVNQLSTSGKKTGVGHYSAQLFDHLRQQAGPDQIDGFPGTGLRHARKVWAQVYPILEKGLKERPPNERLLRLPLPSWRRASLKLMRGIGHGLMAHQFRNRWPLLLVGSWGWRRVGGVSHDASADREAGRALQGGKGG